MSLRSRVRGGAGAREAVELTERRQQARGLVLLALAVLVFSLLRFGFDRVFTPGWSRLW